MAEPFLAEIKIVGFNFAPRGWALCDGQLLPINQNQALYSLLGTTYGGDGRLTFALPDLRGRTPIHASEDHRLGGRGGSENVALSVAQIPNHTHAYRATCAGASTPDPFDAKLAPTAEPGYRATGPRVALDARAVAAAGGGVAHGNMQPYLTLNFVIALTGIFPPRP